MPYTKQELENVDFYQHFVKRLRTQYLEQLDAYVDSRSRQQPTHPYRIIKTANISTPFYRRDRTSEASPDLQSYEDIITGMGIEDADVGEDTIYKTYLLPAWLEAFKTLLIFPYPKYVKTGLLESTIDRSISELAELIVGTDLPEGVENGMVVTNEIADDDRKWLIESNTKRIFPDLGTFYASDLSLGNLETFEQTILDEIVDGDPVE